MKLTWITWYKFWSTTFIKDYPLFNVGVTQRQVRAAITFWSESALRKARHHLLLHATQRHSWNWLIPIFYQNPNIWYSLEQNISPSQLLSKSRHLHIVELPNLWEESHICLSVLVIPELDGFRPIVAPLHHGARLQVVGPELVYVRSLPEWQLPLVRSLWSVGWEGHLKATSGQKLNCRKSSLSLLLNNGDISFMIRL